MTNHQRPYVSFTEIVERVKLITVTLLNSKSPRIFSMFGPDIWNLVLLTLQQPKTGMDQSRLLIDLAFKIVQEYDTAEHLAGYVSSGSWDLVVQSRVF